jgi:hypothetical protein
VTFPLRADRSGTSLVRQRGRSRRGREATVATATGRVPLILTCTLDGSLNLDGGLIRAGRSSPAGLILPAGTASRRGTREQAGPGGAAGKRVPAGEKVPAGVVGRAMTQDPPPAARGGTARYLTPNVIGAIAGAPDIPAPVQPVTGRDRPLATRGTVPVVLAAASGSGRAARPCPRRSARARGWRALLARTHIRPSASQDPASPATANVLAGPWPTRAWLAGRATGPPGQLPRSRPALPRERKGPTRRPGRASPCSLNARTLRPPSLRPSAVRRR